MPTSKPTSGITTPAVIKNFYYSDSQKLQIRLNTWKNFGTNKLGLDDWLIEQILQQKHHYEKFLDAGCGTGQLISKARNIANSIHGLDLSEKLVLEARILNSDIAQNIVVGDLSKTEFPDGLFDLITAVHVFHHVPNITAGLLELKRICAVDGNVIITAGDYQLNEGLNKLHYEALKELAFPEFMLSQSAYLEFGHEQATKYLDQIFSTYKTAVYENNLRFYNPEPAVAYYESAMMFRNSLGPADSRLSFDHWARLKKLVFSKINKIISTDGVFTSPGRVYAYIYNKQAK